MRKKEFILAVYILQLMQLIYAGGEPELRTVPSNILYGNVKEITYVIESYGILDMPGYSPSISILRTDLDLHFPSKPDIETINVIKKIVTDSQESEIVQQYSISSENIPRYNYPENSHGDLHKIQSVSGDFVEYLDIRSDDTIGRRETYYYRDKKLMRRCSIQYTGDGTGMPSLDIYTTSKYEHDKYCKLEHVVCEMGINMFTQIYKFDEHQNLISIERFYINNSSLNNSHTLIKVEYEYDEYQNWITARVYQIEKEKRNFVSLINRNIEYN